MTLERLTHSGIPQIIYSLWLQGRDNAPSIVRLNLERWADLNQNYRIEILDRRAVETLLSGLPFDLDHFTPQALSDVVRAFLLMRTGGVWVDASVFPARPLDDWLPDVLTPSGFFAFERPGPDRPISSWFLAATAQNRMIRAWWNRIAAYWSVPRTLREGIPEDPVSAVTSWRDGFPYFWFHYLFQSLLDQDAEFAASWANCIKMSAEPPHAMQARLGDSPQLGRFEIARLAELAPVHKLNWRASYPVEALAAVGRATDLG